MSPWELFVKLLLCFVKILICFIKRSCLNVSLYPMYTTAILQYLKLLGYATLHFRKWNDVLVVFPLATYSPNKLRQISNNYTFAVKIKIGDHLLPQKCMMMSFLYREKRRKQAESPTYTKNRRIPLQFHNARFYSVQYLCSQ